MIAAGQRRRAAGRVHQRRRSCTSVDRASTQRPFGAPARARGRRAATRRSRSTNFGKAYLAFTAADGSGDDVRAAYYYNGAWALEPAAAERDRRPTTPGPGRARPRSRPRATASAIVAWGEGGHIYLAPGVGDRAERRDEQADARAAGLRARCRPTARRSGPAATPRTPTSRSARCSRADPAARSSRAC